MRRLVLAAAIGGFPGCSGSTADVVSCSLGGVPYSTCTDYSPASLGFTQGDCALMGGHWSSSGCDPSMSVGGCRRTEPTGHLTTTTWYGDTLNASTRLNDSCQGGTILRGGVTVTDGSTADGPLITETVSLGSCTFHAFASPPCSDLPLPATFLSRISDPSSRPAPQGGPLVDGIYDLTEYRSYTNSGGGTPTSSGMGEVRGSIAIFRGGSALEVAMQDFSVPEQRQGYNVTPPGATYFAAYPGCDAGNAILDYDYTASGSTIVLMTTNNTNLTMTYQRRCP